MGGLLLPFLWAESFSVRSMHKSEANELLEEGPDSVSRRGAGLYFHKRKGQVRSRGSCEAGQCPVSQFADGDTRSRVELTHLLHSVPLSCHICTLQELLRLNTLTTHILSKQTERLCSSPQATQPGAGFEPQSLTPEATCWAVCCLLVELLLPGHLTSCRPRVQCL